MFDRIKWKIEILFRTHPVTLFQFCVFAFHHDAPLSIVPLIGALLVDRQFRSIAVVDRWSSEVWKVVRYVKKHSAWRFKRIDLSSVLSRDVIERYQGQLLTEAQMRAEARLRKLLQLNSVDEHLRKRTRIYVVSRGNDGESPCPTAFRVDLGGFIFITVKPEDIGGIQRFFLLHELGHLSQFSTYTTRRARFGGSPFFVAYIWAIPQLIYPEFTFWSFLVLGVYLLVLQMFRDVFWWLVQSEGDAFNEMASDQFALQNLSRKELFAVARLYQRWPIPVDHSLLPAHDKIRREVLRINLKQAFENRGRIAKPVVPRQQPRTEWPVWVSLALTVVLASFANAPTDPVISVLASVSMLSLAFTWTRYFRTRSLEQWIERVLSSDPLTPAETVRRWPSEPWWHRHVRIFLGYESQDLSPTQPPFPWPWGKLFRPRPMPSPPDESTAETKPRDTTSS
jgi:hypothetical protein